MLESHTSVELSICLFFRLRREKKSLFCLSCRRQELSSRVDQLGAGAVKKSNVNKATENKYPELPPQKGIRVDSVCVRCEGVLWLAGRLRVGNVMFGVFVLALRADGSGIFRYWADGGSEFGEFKCQNTRANANKIFIQGNLAKSGKNTKAPLDG